MSPRICLVADDNQNVRAYVRNILANSGFKVVEAENAAHGLRLAEDFGESLALIISDINMPGGSGLTFAWAVRESTPTLPIVIISGSVEPELLNQLKTSFEVVQKPFVASTLLSAIEHATTAEEMRKRREPQT